MNLTGFLTNQELSSRGCTRTIPPHSQVIRKDPVPFLVRGLHMANHFPSGSSETFLASASSATVPAPLPLEDQPTLAPVRLEERISALDTVRGFALLGILVINITAFGLPAPAYWNPAAAGGTTGWNLYTWAVTEVLADGKMRAIFSLAFGASVLLLVERLSRKGAGVDAADIHYRRMLWLLVFGLIHAYLIWFGDILFPYAMMGLVLFPLRKLSPRAMLITAGIMMLVMTGDAVRYYFHLKNEQREYAQILADEKAGKELSTDQKDTKKDWEDTLKEFSPSPDDLKKETDAHRGSYLQLLAFRSKQVFRMHSRPIYLPIAWFDFLAMMLFGMAFLKLGVLHGCQVCSVLRVDGAAFFCCRPARTCLDRVVVLEAAIQH